MFIGVFFLRCFEPVEKTVIAAFDETSASDYFVRSYYD